jgi:chemotaxis protein CheC
MMTKLEGMETKALKEACNVVAEKISEALSKMANCKVDVKAKRVEKSRVEELKKITKEYKSVSVGMLFDIVGDMKGSVLILWPDNTIRGLVGILDNGRKCGRTLNEMDRSIINEVGNILVGAYTTVLSDISGMNILESVPHLQMNNIPDIIKNISRKYNHEVDCLVVIKASLSVKKHKVKDELIFVIGHKEMGRLFQTIVDRFGEPGTKPDGCKNFFK